MYPGNKHVWTAEEDAAIVTGRTVEPRATFDAIGASLGIGRDQVIDRAIGIGVHTRGDRTMMTRFKPSAEPDASDFDRRRECLPAGHPVTWNAITVGTCLEGQRYPL